MKTASRQSSPILRVYSGRRPLSLNNKIVRARNQDGGNNLGSKVIGQSQNNWAEKHGPNMGCRMPHDEKPVGGSGQPTKFRQFGG